MPHVLLISNLAIVLYINAPYVCLAVFSKFPPTRMRFEQYEEWIKDEHKAFGAEVCHCSYSTMYFNAISLFDEIANAITLGEIKDFKKKYVLQNYLLLMILVWVDLIKH
ncbi:MULTISPECIES: hypothetical protein [unclassified Acinetobacter]|uniref:hypothetical protein n=1 Tax=unclassified Acinetobacter TaxID=196816 RepID=UPI0029344C7B|nr:MULTISPECIES: hypothetical protein [unclassified Acinetobacter]WOE32813.1 hypothetical protein QSG84_06470 [Acinetobacter sp. SAAs470]WOE38290.1 hypothetical protein QSG86_15525 [Acinetobacter sp. SAAs474]